jgi:two-component system OmpR family response regulator
MKIPGGDRILVVDDDEEMGRLLSRGLGDEGYLPTRVGDGIEALVAASEHDFAAAVIDVMMPGMSGFEVCRRLRESSPFLPIILLTARDAVDDRIRGLDAGADDYLTKPFAFSELAARLRALRRRELLVPAKTVTLGRLTIDNHDHIVTLAGAPIPLSPKEFAVLRMLGERAEETVTRSDLLATIWGSVEHTDANVVDQYVSYLRRKIDADASRVVITTVRGIGFTLTVEPE